VPSVHECDSAASLRRDPRMMTSASDADPERCYEGLPKPDPLNYNGDFELLSERSTEMATTQAILRGKDTTAQGELYSSFELGDKQWKITTSDAKRNASCYSVAAGDTRAARRGQGT
jgi:hypothetical protein